MMIDMRYTLNQGSNDKDGKARKRDTRNAGDTAVKGIVDVTKIAVVGSVAAGLIGGVGAAFKK